MFHSESLGYTIAVETFYDGAHSNPLQKHYLYQYSITITNVSGKPSRLLSRTWYIEDAEGQIRKVEGPGVIGQTPWFEKGEAFNYSSFCPLPTLTGKMWGQFHMKDRDGHTFGIDTPAFHFAVPETMIDRY